MKLTYALPIIFYYAKYRNYPKLNYELVKKNFSSNYKYGGKKIMNAEETNHFIFDALQNDKPFMAGRYGSSELFVAVADYFRLESKYDRYLDILCKNAGFFPHDREMAHKFSQALIDSTKNCDLLGTWYRMYEEFFMKKFMTKESRGSFLFSLEPWTYIELPWTRALEGKKVLVIHPFVESIQKQFLNRKKIWGETDILPEFELITLKAVQTVAGERDSRFTNWFEALNWMHQETKKIDFDIAILGCGAYGFPLASMIKNDGKKAIHLGGVTQIMFGIKGRRWEENDVSEYIRPFFNEYWVSPLESERPQNASCVENGCYW